MGRKNPRVDAYIERQAPFAKPILRHLRKMVHAASPDIEEELKWGAPAFMHKGIVCGMAAFQRHCVFGFWKHSLILTGAEKKAHAQAMWRARITKVGDLPSDRLLLQWVKKAVRLNDEGVKVARKITPAAERKLTVPAYFMSALRRNRKALATFQSFSYTNRKDYVEWVTEAKTDATREKRLGTALEWMAEGKPRNWKYERK